MAGNYICDVRHNDFGLLKVYEMQNGMRCYAIHEDIGQIPFQNKDAQNLLRGLVIKAGHGDKLIRKPTMLEIANYAPEKIEPVETSEIVEQLQNEVVEDLHKQSQERKPLQPPKKRKPLFSVGLFSKGGEE